MKRSIRLIGAAFLLAFAAHGAEPGRPRLNIQHDRENNRVVISWYGSAGELSRSARVGAPFQRTLVRATPAPLEIEGDQGAYALTDTAGSVVSVNMVGYVTLQLPWGMSLIANPLIQSNVTLHALFPTAPDGAQIMKLVNGDYVTSTFSAATAAWTRPQLEVPIGVGFFFINPSRDAFTQIFVGELWPGLLTNNLPAGVSFEGALLPQAGSINILHTIPGEPGDTIFFFANQGEARGQYVRSRFTSDSGWTPDLELGVAQGFWIQKRTAQDWIRAFSIGP